MMTQVNDFQTLTIDTESSMLDAGGDIEPTSTMILLQTNFSFGSSTCLRYLKSRDLIEVDQVTLLIAKMKLFVTIVYR